MKTGTILNCAYNDNLFMKLISWRNKLHNKSKWTHTAIVITEIDEYNNVQVAEALGKGFVISEYPAWWIYLKQKEGKIELGETNKPLKNVYDLAKKYEGARYGWSAIFHIVLSFFTKDNDYTDGEKHLICSEAVARILYDASNKKIDFVKEFKKSYDLITPDDLSVSKQISWDT